MVRIHNSRNNTFRDLLSGYDLSGPLSFHYFISEKNHKGNSYNSHL